MIFFKEFVNCFLHYGNLILLILFAFSVSQCKGDKDPWWILFPGQSTWSAIAIILFIAFVAGGTYYLCTREEKKMEKEKKDRGSSKEKSKSKDINLKKLVDKYMKKHKKKEDEDDGIEKIMFVYDLF